ncbi:sigma-70 family RNA polymerase sigma factor [Paenibacillus psychroresistens]|uniref:RNA polymerase sigma factor n=1 Tax=Paenibacillus psychroresistens TaxID=1778678 RepID=A0A6B8RFS3_9BACL|nr:sigma-70 family RNA polymerase sigma factor [Paenibacillus psychroresistens]QGQ94216.1 sigma-70 family RNA polymerase sigma factor [Paenibacillus psychroresistens]
MEQNSCTDSMEMMAEIHLVEHARAGNREAFGELVRRHRAKALGWASSFSADTAMAEDIVQEALIRAFLHVSNLSDVSRFKPWLRRIVQNQANQRFRRGGPYGNERPFTSMEGHAASMSSASWNNADWRDIDSILFHFSQSLKKRHSEDDPEVRVVRAEMVEGIVTLLGCLSKHERNVFEAHFFRQLPFAEIAALFGTSTSNVYTLLSRSRKKVQKERVRVYFQDVAKKLMSEGKPTRRILTRPFDF